ncbi:WD-REPEATS-REGION domain-containing protein [Mycena kentingensis (nom. inval.)]|nr:WD-REPEATS-REGION domain-containing protein [Mycena kentingensis (nom. inval.)]
MATRLAIPSTLVTAPTPDPSPVAQSTRTPSSKGKRKADDVDTTPPDRKSTSFAVPPRTVRASNATSNAPSSYHRQKRARLSTQSDSSDTPTQQDANATTVGSWSSRRSTHRPLSRAQSLSQQSSLHRASSRRSMSQSSIPISALISPHAPSIALSTRHNAFHMRDPHKPPKIQLTAWTLSMGEVSLSRGSWRRYTETGGSPLHAWLFFAGFVIFPIWWVASFMNVLQTRRVGHDIEGKGTAEVVLDDPQVEHGAFL